MNLEKEIKLLQLQMADALRKIKAKSISWGQILGDIRNQKDLMRYFNLKQDVSKKVTDFTIINNTLYPSVKAVKEQLDLKLPKDFSTLTDVLLPLVNTDLFIVARGGVAYKVTKSELGGSQVNKQIFHWWGGNWSTPTLDRYYYISYNGNAIEGLNNNIASTMSGRNKGLFIAPFNCKIKRVVFKEAGSGTYTGSFLLVTGLPSYNNTWNLGYSNIVTHINSSIVATGYEQRKFEFLVNDNITVPKGYVVSPMLIFSAQFGANKIGIEISVEIEEV